MTDAGQAVVLGADSDVQRTIAARATNAVGKPQTPFSTSKPAASNVSHSQADACSSSKPSSGLEWMRWLRLTRSSIVLIRAVPARPVWRLA